MEADSASGSAAEVPASVERPRWWLAGSASWVPFALGGGGGPSDRVSVIGDDAERREWMWSRSAWAEMEPSEVEADGGGKAAGPKGGSALEVVEGVGKVEVGGVMEVKALRVYEVGDVLMLRPTADD